MIIIKLKNMDGKGFTLIELLIVVAIVGILAAIAIPQFAAYRERSYKVAMKSDLRNAYSMTRNYYSEHPDASTAIGIDIAESYGLRISPNVTLSGSISPTSGSYTASHSLLPGVTGVIDNTGAISGL